MLLAYFAQEHDLCKSTLTRNYVFNHMLRAVVLTNLLFVNVQWMLVMMEL